MKHLVFTFLIGSLVLSPLTLNAQSAERREANNPERPPQEVPFSTVKERFETRLEKALERLERVENNIKQSSMNADRKEIVLEGLEIKKDAFATYQERLEDAESLEDIREINRDISEVLKEEERALRDSARTATIDFGERSEEKFERFLQQGRQTLEKLQDGCPNQASTLNELQKELAKLPDSLTELSNATRANDATFVRQQVRDLTHTAREILRDMREVRRECQTANAS